MCLVMVAPHLIGLLQLYCVSKKVFNDDRIGGTVDQVVESLLQTMVTLLEVIERVDAPFSESLTKAIARLLSEKQFNQTPSSPGTSVILESEKSKKGLFEHYSEEIRRDVSKITSLMITKASSIALSSLSSQSHLNSLLFIVSQVLDIAVHDRNRSNQKLALECVNNICNALSTGKSIDISDSSGDGSRVPIDVSGEKAGKRSEIISSILPGILSSCTRVILGDFKQGQEVFVQAFRLLSTAICETMADEKNKEALNRKGGDDRGPNGSEVDPKESMKEKLKSLSEIYMRRKGDGMNSLDSEESSSSGQSKSPSITQSSKSSSSSQSSSIGREGEWLKNASYHVNNLLGRIFSMGRIMSEERSKNVSMSVIVYKSVEVRKEMASCVSRIFRLCRLTLLSSFPILFEFLVLFSFDEYPDVSSICQSSLESAMTDFSSKSLPSPSLFSSQIYKLVQSITRIMLDPDDHKKLLLLRLLTGWLRIFPNLTKSFLPSLCHALTLLSRFQISLTSSISNNPLISLLPASTGTQETPILAHLALQDIQQSYRHQFTHFNDLRVYHGVVTLMRHLGACMDVEMVFHLLFPSIAPCSLPSPTHSEDESLYESSSSIYDDIPSALFLLNEAMLGASGFLEISTSRRIKLSSDARKRLKYQWEHYLSFLMGDSVWKGDWMEKEAKNAKLDKIHQLRLILIMEGVGNMAMVFGKTFSKYYVQVLYRMLWMAGSEDEQKAKIGKMTLVRMAEYGGWKSVVEMVRANVDYVMEEMIGEVKYGEGVETAMKVFEALWHISSEMMMPQVEDMIEDVFRRLDYGRREEIELLIGVMAKIVRQVSQKIPLGTVNRIERRKMNDAMMKEIERSRRKRGRRGKSTKSKRVLRTPMASHTDSLLRQDCTMHAWIRRCEMKLTEGVDGAGEGNFPNHEFAENSNSPSPYIQTETWRKSLERSYEMEEMKERGGGSAESNEYPSSTHLSHGSSPESHGATTHSSSNSFSIKAWVSMRVKRRINESAVSIPSPSSTQHPNGIPSSSPSSKSIEEYFIEHHREKEGREERGDDIHSIHRDESESDDDNDGSDGDIDEKDDSEMKESQDQEEGGNHQMDNFDMESDEEYEFYEKDQEDGDEKVDNAFQESTSESHKERKRQLKVPPRKMHHRPGYDLVHRICQRLQHWMNHGDVQVRAMVMEVLEEGVAVLAEHKKVLLPSIHTLWSPLQWRFMDGDWRVASRALKVASEMARYGRGFISQKFINDLWPILKDALLNHFNIFNIDAKRRIFERRRAGNGAEGSSGNGDEMKDSLSNSVSQYTPFYGIRDGGGGAFHGKGDAHNAENSLERETREKLGFASKAASQASQSSQSSSSSKSTYSVFLNSSSYHVQKGIIEILLFASSKLSLPIPSLADIARNTWFYLDEHQPKELQQAARKLFVYLLTRRNIKDSPSKSKSSDSSEGGSTSSSSGARYGRGSASSSSSGGGGGDTNQTFLLLSTLLHSPFIPPSHAQSFMREENDGTDFILPILLPPSSSILPSNFSGSPSSTNAFFERFHKNVEAIISLQDGNDCC